MHLKELQGGDREQGEGCLAVVAFIEGLKALVGVAWASIIERALAGGAGLKGGRWGWEFGGWHGQIS